jgi:hypothetical protein
MLMKEIIVVPDRIVVIAIALRKALNIITKQLYQEIKYKQGYTLV